MRRDEELEDMPAAARGEAVSHVNATSEGGAHRWADDAIAGALIVLGLVLTIGGASPLAIVFGVIAIVAGASIAILAALS